MIAIALRPATRRWNTVSFASTLYLPSILDLLLAEVPPECEAELRLGLQEALVNAAKHGNQLDLGKTVMVRFSISPSQVEWIIGDQGSGFAAPTDDAAPTAHLPQAEWECGRGLYILHQIFDRVYWNDDGTELRLSKNLNPRSAKRLALR